MSNSRTGRPVLESQTRILGDNSGLSPGRSPSRPGRLSEPPERSVLPSGAKARLVKMWLWVARITNGSASASMSQIPMISSVFLGPTLAVVPTARRRPSGEKPIGRPCNTNGSSNTRVFRTRPVAASQMWTAGSDSRVAVASVLPSGEDTISRTPPFRAGDRNHSRPVARSQS